MDVCKLTARKRARSGASRNQGPPFFSIQPLDNDLAVACRVPRYRHGDKQEVFAVPEQLRLHHLFFLRVGVHKGPKRTA